ncbi:MAG: extensin family protein [Pseudomonadota bacterium]
MWSTGGKQFAKWRVTKETSCLRAGVGRGSPWVTTRSSLGGPKFCGAIRPFRVRALSAGTVRLNPAATVRCPMIPAMDRWMHEVVQPAARRFFASRVTNVKILASYGCRPRNNKPGAKLSEHSFANAIDVARFTFADGRTADVRRWRKGAAGERGFLRAVHKGSCKVFTTVLGPDADKYHWDHFHFDLARHGKRGNYHYCR